jgi:TRAP-type mannitol/chloroaromatic compound transport system permease small subunit
LEHASSSWAPAIYPYKTLMALGFILFFLQGVAKLIQDIRSLKETP